MTNTAATNQHARRHDTPTRAVLFDLSGTLLDERYIPHGVEHLAAELHRRWDIDPTVTSTGFLVTFRAVSQEWADQLAASPTKALMLSKWLLNRSMESARGAAFEDEAWAQEMASYTSDFQEGVEAFKARRDVHFRGW